MSGETYSFRIGSVQCLAVSDGSFSYPTNWFFSNVPQEDLERELRARQLEPDQIISTYTCLLIKTERNKVLVDAGAANLAPTTGELLRNLEKAGVKAAEIDTVLLTHGHPDHIGGAIDAEGRPTFPNARYIMWKAEWDFWTATEIDLGAMAVPEEIKNLLRSTAQRCLPPLEKQMELLERETEIVPGVRAIPAPGHTPGHVVITVTSGGEGLLDLGDAVLHPVHLEQPSWQTAFDLVQDQAAKTRRQLLDRAAAEGMKVRAFHFPFPTLGQVVTRGKGWAWEPTC
jgi:glyoxylase-like metal-dependent hydrolase (beta-lactamase superfamily II)